MTGHAGSTPAHPVCLEMLSAIRARFPRIVTVYGGVYPTYHPEEILVEESGREQQLARHPGRHWVAYLGVQCMLGSNPFYWRKLVLATYVERFDPDEDDGEDEKERLDPACSDLAPASGPSRPRPAITPEVRVVWATATGELVTKLPSAKGEFALCQFTPNGLLAVTDTDRTDLYDIPSGTVAKSWPVGRVARLTADAKTFVRVEKEFQTISLGNAASGAVAGTLAVKTADNGEENGLAFSADGKKLAVVHDRERLQVWDTATRKLLREAKIQCAVARDDLHYAVAFSPDGETVSLDTRFGEIERWDTRSLHPLPTLRAPWATYSTYIRGVQWSKDGRTLLAVAGDGLVLRWNAKTGKRSPDGVYNSRLCFAVTPNGSHLVVGDLAGRIEVWDVATGRIARQLAKGLNGGDSQISRPLVCLAVSPDGRRLAAGAGHCDIQVVHIDGGKGCQRLTCPLRLDGGWMKRLVWAPDGTSLFADGSGMIICRVNLADGKTVWDNWNEDMPWFALTPDGRFVVKTLWDSIQFLDASTGKASLTVRMAMPSEQSSVGAVAVTSDGQQLALAVGSHTVAVCDRAGRELRRFPAADPKPRPTRAALAGGRQVGDEGHCRVGALAFTPDGKWIVSGADDFSVRAWEAATGKQIVRFDGHNSGVEQVTVAPDARSAFSAGGDGFVCQWDLTPRPYPRPRQQSEDLWAAAAEPDPAFAVAAAWALVTRSEESRAFVAEKLPLFATVKHEEIANWLADLDSPVFADREAATKALATRGRAVERQLREMARTTTSLEVRRRAEDLIARLRAGYTDDELRGLRLVQACEFAGTAAAREMLKRWAGGEVEAVLTDDAKAALARLDRRRK